MRHLACLLVVLTAACVDDRSSRLALPGTGAPTAPSSVPSSATLSGRVFESTSRGPVAVAGAEIYVWVDEVNRGYSRAGGTTDEEGRYIVRDLPLRSLVVLSTPYVRGRSFLQPAAAAATMDADVELDIELVSTVLPVRTVRGSPSLSGTISESTPAGTRPVSGAQVLYDWSCFDLVNAATVTDATGRYELSRLPLPRRGRSCVFVRAGSRSKNLDVEIRDDTVLDINFD